jgi:hypothetical protein
VLRVFNWPITKLSVFCLCSIRVFTQAFSADEDKETITFSTQQEFLLGAKQQSPFEITLKACLPGAGDEVRSRFVVFIKRIAQSRVCYCSSRRVKCPRISATSWQGAL